MTFETKKGEDKLVAKKRKQAVGFAYIKDRIIFGGILTIFIILGTVGKLSAYDLVWRKNATDEYWNGGKNCDMYGGESRIWWNDGEAYWERTCYNPNVMTYVFAPFSTVFPFRLAAGPGKAGIFRAILTNDFFVWLYNGLYLYGWAMAVDYLLRRRDW